jgi:hypothetical protein
MLALTGLAVGLLALMWANAALSQSEIASQLTYQGTLFEGGAPVTGTRDMTFRLFTDDLCTTQTGPDIVRNSVAVEDGFFTVYLDVNPALFDGQALWIQPAIGGTAFACQALLPAPYALTLRPGAIIRGSTSSANGLLELENEGPGQAIRVTSTDGMVLYGATAGGPAIYGYASGGYGVRGVSSASGSAGVRGETSSTDSFGGDFYSNQSTGVNGVTASVVATPVPGVGNTYVAGVRGVAQSSGYVYGVYAESQAGNSGAGLYAANSGPGEYAPDIELGGGANGNGVLASDQGVGQSTSNLALLSNDDILLFLDNDRSFETSSFEVRNRDNGTTAGTTVFSVSDGGDAVAQGIVTGENGLTTGSTSGDGVYVFQTGGFGSSVTSGNDNGVEVRSAAGDGLFVRATGGHGVQVYDADGRGLYVRGAGSHGVYVEDAAADNYFAGDTGIGVSSPTHRLHVVDSISGAASTANHVALIENVTAGGSADILVIKMPEVGNAVDTGNNYITFHDGDGASQGAIQGNGAGSVQYAGAGNDYAEYLPRLDIQEEIQPGDVVGIFAGRVSKATAGADLVLAASTGSIVAGNDPGEGNRDDYALIAFLGQVDLRVRGPVSSGDFVVPSGLEDGTAVAVAPADLTLDQISRVIGQAWQGDADEGVKQVRVLVGLVQPAAFSAALAEVDTRLDALERALSVAGQ